MLSAGENYSTDYDHNQRQQNQLVVLITDNFRGKYPPSLSFEKLVVFKLTIHIARVLLLPSNFTLRINSFLLCDVNLEGEITFNKV